MSLRVGIDIGGTFTDLVAIAADGRVLTRKAASTPRDYGEGIVAGLADLLAEAEASVAEVLHATTIGSNTILEGRGARTALITTRGGSATRWKSATCGCRGSTTCIGPSRPRWWSGGCGWK